MRRLVWIGVGVVVTVVVIRKGRAVLDAYVPAGATDAVSSAARFGSALRTVRSEFVAGMSERERQLRHDLVGDVDVDAIRAERPDRVADLRGSWSSRRPAAGDTAAPGPTEDPDDDDGYTFF
ncbi:hypothetical protein [Cellulomonas sp. URHD0024]|uniref:hypothetical protein n=1 Tax=Cellulomonas sp. URHD0024 TaxID=1302620 RepID=UPI0004226FAF|nr:hypothetical protein [Cellulomonas sp. URHD0024]